MLNIEVVKFTVLDPDLEIRRGGGGGLGNKVKQFLK